VGYTLEKLPMLKPISAASSAGPFQTISSRFPRSPRLFCSVLPDKIPCVTIPRPDLVSVLEKTTLFAELAPDEVRMLASRTVRKLFSAGELLFSEGEPCAGLHMISKGKVRIFKTSVSGREQVLTVNVAGESVAELPVFDGGPYPASALAMEDSEIAFTSRRDLHAFCIEHPEVALKMLSVVGARLRRLVGIIEELSFTTIRQRLISVLVKLAHTEGRKTEQGIEFHLPVTHQELANQLGTVRELISRNLMRLQAEGLLDVDARQIVVKDMKGLSALLESSS
jgi:CRP/FNR family transcriptional regulator, cyclic AMP receptor protein